MSPNGLNCHNHVVHHAGIYSRYEILLAVTRWQYGYLSKLSVASQGARRERFRVELTTENVEFVCTVRYSRYGQPINDCPRPR